MGLHQRRTHPAFIEGCFGCKVATINFGTVPGGSKDARTNISHGLETEHNLTRYEERKKAGEQPSGTTKKSRKRDAYKQHLAEKHLSNLADHNPESTITKVKRSLLNQE